VDWARLRAVVIESDDWGLCAWVPDENAYRALADSPAWRSPVGRIYGRSTLESANDIARLAEILLGFRGGDGFPPVWQANTIMAAPDYDRLAPPLFEVEELPLVTLPDTPSRWSRPGLWEAVQEARNSGAWWPELHGLHHVPATAWLTALRRGVADARRAHEQQCLVCAGVEASAEYDRSEPEPQRTRSLGLAVDRFQALFGRRPESLCPPDYRWDETLERDAERLGVTTIQGKGEQAVSFPRLRRLVRQIGGIERSGKRFYMPPRIAFEPRGSASASARLGPERAHRNVRGAWGRGQPAVVSTHRVNFAHLDEGWSEKGRAALGDLLQRLAADSAIFLTDAEVRSLEERGWSARPIGDRGALVRCYATSRPAVRFSPPAGVASVNVLEGRGPGASVRLEDGDVVAELDRGEYLLEWGRA